MFRVASVLRGSMSATTSPSTSSENVFNIVYAGLVQDLNFTAIDPSGRTDMLKIVDNAQASGAIPHQLDQMVEEHVLSIRQLSIEVSTIKDQSVCLRVPLHLIASIGYLEEDGVHLLLLNVAPRQTSPQNRDIVVMIARSKSLAESICTILSSRFQAVYGEAVLQIPRAGGRGSQLSSPASRYAPARAQASAGTRGTSIYTASDGSTDAAADYHSMLSSELSLPELESFMLLFRRWQNEGLPLKEFAYKIMQLFGPTRTHLLTSLRHLLPVEDQLLFRDFLYEHGLMDDGASTTSSVQI